MKSAINALHSAVADEWSFTYCCNHACASSIDEKQMTGFVCIATWWDTRIYEWIGIRTRSNWCRLEPRRNPNEWTPMDMRKRPAYTGPEGMSDHMQCRKEKNDSPFEWNKKRLPFEQKEIVYRKVFITTQLIDIIESSEHHSIDLDELYPSTVVLDDFHSGFKRQVTRVATTRLCYVAGMPTT